MRRLHDRLSHERVLLADGAWGSQLIAQGLDLARECAEVWNLRRAHRVARLVSEYALSADILTTNTFGANRIRLARYGLERDLHRINERGVALARGAALASGRPDGAILVTGAMGPARGPESSEPDRGLLVDVYAEQAACLAAAGASFILLETITSLIEARIALRAVRSVTDLEVVCSFAFREIMPGHFETWAGETVEAALRGALDDGACVVGANCIPATASVLHLIDSMRRAVGPTPLWLKPNAGAPTRGESRFNYPAPLAEAPLEDILDALGHGVIGGCCGTGPAEIAALRGLIDRRARNV